MPSAMFDTLGVRSKDIILQHLFLSWCMLGTDTRVRPRRFASSVAWHLTFHAQKLQFAEYFYFCENLRWLLAVNLCNLVARLPRWLRGYKPGTCCESLWLCSLTTAEKEEFLLECIAEFLKFYQWSVIFSTWWLTVMFWLLYKSRSIYLEGFLGLKRLTSTCLFSWYHKPKVLRLIECWLVVWSVGSPLKIKHKINWWFCS